MTTISVSTTAGIVLNSASYANPIVIATDVTISGPNSPAPASVFASAGYWTIQNNGYVGVGAGFGGVDLYRSGSVTNEASGSIVSIFDAINLGGGGGVGAVLNDGTIAGTGTSGTGIRLNAGGSVTNVATGSITGVLRGIIVGGMGGVVNDGQVESTGTNGDAILLGYYGDSVINAGSISATADGGIGVYLLSGGSVTNLVSASITDGKYGVFALDGPGTVVNDGRIVSEGMSGVAVLLNFAAPFGGDDGSGSVSNAASALIEGARYGVQLVAGGTLTNAGTIVGGETAVAFGGTIANRLVLDPGYKFSGVVTGSASASNTLELASAASIGTVTALGTQFTNFGPIVFDPGGEWSISGNTSGLAGVISGFTTADTIVLTGVTAIGSGFVGGVLTLDEAGGASATLDLPGPFTLANFDVTPGVFGGTEVTFVPCFRAGTRILTVAGEVAVEELRIGDRVMTLLGCRVEPVVWLGHRHVNCLGHPRAQDVWPVRVKAGAIVDGVPHRDLWLSPEHAVLFRDEAGDVLVPVRHLLNGTTIAQVPCASVSYWHVELAEHDAIVADGLPAETYLDTGNRADFANGGAAVTVHPNFADAVWRAKACAPQLREGEVLAALRRRLALRATVRAGEHEAAECVTRAAMNAPGVPARR